jgi:hypothetical protein
MHFKIYRGDKPVAFTNGVTFISHDPVLQELWKAKPMLLSTGENPYTTVAVEPVGKEQVAIAFAEAAARTGKYTYVQEEGSVPE